MKKLLALVLVISLLGVPFGAFAEGLNLEGVTSEDAVIDTTGASDKLISKAASSTDKVEDIDGNLVVTTNYGVVLTCSVPSGVYALTQSYFHDIALYNSVYPDPAAIIEKFINDEMHLNLFTGFQAIGYQVRAFGLINIQLLNRRGHSVFQCVGTHHDFIIRRGFGQRGGHGADKQQRHQQGQALFHGIHLLK